MPWSPILILNLRSATRRWDFLQVICISFNFVSIAISVSVLLARRYRKVYYTTRFEFSNKNYCHFEEGEQDGERTTACRHSGGAVFHNGYQA